MGSTYGYYQSHRSYASVNTPGFRNLKVKERPMNPHFCEIIKDTSSSFSWSSIWYGLGGEVSSGGTRHSSHTDGKACPVGAHADVSHLVEARSIALGRAARKLSGFKVNLAQAFAERKQTANLLISTAMRITRAAVALRQLRFGDVYHALGVTNVPGTLLSRERLVRKTKADARLSSHWLEYKYGWGPLIQDAYGAAELLAYHAANDLYHERVETSGKRTDSGTVTYSFPWGTRSYSKETKTKFIFDYRLESEARVKLAQTGLTNPALLAWELLPYSFVVDWFIPVGNYLEMLDAFSGFELVKGCEVNLTKTNSQRVFSESWEWNYNSYWKVRERHSGSWSRRHVRLDRVVLNSFPTQAFPGFRNPLGGNPIDRFATALSLLRQAFR